MSRVVEALCGFLLFNVFISYGESQSCTTYFTNTVCTGIADKFPNSGMSLKCDNCTLNTVDGKTLEKFRGFNLFFSHSHVRTIKEDAFALPEIIIVLDFSYNQLSDLNANIFKDAINLQLLRLDNNYYHQLSPATLDGLHVCTLNISSNYLSEIKKDTFRNVKICNNINYLTLRYKCELILSNNGLRKIYPYSFQMDGIYQLLDLSNNNLTELVKDVFSNLYLDISRNSIAKLDPTAFGIPTKLLKLNMEFDEIETIPNGFFGGLQKLQTLRLNNNRIKVLKATMFLGLLSLTNLDKSNNRIEEIGENVLFPLGQLEHLNVSFNRLQKLNVENLLKNQQSLQNILIRHNFWSCKDLLDMYRLFNTKQISLDRHSRYDVHVPNRHGIACAKSPFTLDAGKDYETFLREISRDPIGDDFYVDPAGLEDTKKILASYVNGIYHASVLFVTLYLGTVLVKIVRWLHLRAYRKNGDPTNFNCF